MTEKATVVVESDDLDIRMESTGSKSIIANALDSVAHVCRVEHEKDGLSDDIDTAYENGAKLANALNQEVYRCECGKLFGSQNSYAGHKNHCTTNA